MMLRCYWLSASEVSNLWGGSPDQFCVAVEHVEGPVGMDRTNGVYSMPLDAGWPCEGGGVAHHAWLVFFRESGRWQLKEFDHNPFGSFAVWLGLRKPRKDEMVPAEAITWLDVPEGK